MMSSGLAVTPRERVTQLASASRRAPVPAGSPYRCGGRSRARTRHRRQTVVGNSDRSTRPVADRSATLRSDLVVPDHRRGAHSRCERGGRTPAPDRHRHGADDTATPGVALDVTLGDQSGVGLGDRRARHPKILGDAPRRAQPIPRSQLPLDDRAPKLLIQLHAQRPRIARIEEQLHEEDRTWSGAAGRFGPSRTLQRQPMVWVGKRANGPAPVRSVWSRRAGRRSRGSIGRGGGQVRAWSGCSGWSQRHGHVGDVQRLATWATSPAMGGSC